MVHVLYVAWGLPPGRKTGGHRGVATLGELVRAGAEVTSLAASKESFAVFYETDRSLESLIPSEVNVERVPFVPEHLWPLANDWPWERVGHPGRWHKAIRDRVERIYPEPVYASWLVPALRMAQAINAERPIDLVLATGNPYVDFEVAYRLHLAEGIPFVLDDRDSFLLETYSGAPSKFHAERVGLYQDYLSSCLEYWCVNPPLAAAHRDGLGHLGHKVRVVENGWDPVAVPATTRTYAGGPIRFGYVGTITPHLPMDGLLTAWSAFAGATGATGTGAELHLYGDIGFSKQAGAGGALPERIRSTGGVTYHGHVSRTALPDVYGELDALVLVAPGGKYITASKVYEYMASGLPIAALGLEGLDAMRVLCDYPRLHAAPLSDLDAARRALVNAASDAATSRDSERDRALQWAEQWRRDRVLAPAVRRVLEAAE